MEQYIGVKYKLKSSDQFEEYLKFINVGFILRKTAIAASPVSVLTLKDCVYTLTMYTSFRTITNVFKIDEEFDEDRPDGTKVKSVFTIEGNKLIQVQTEPSGLKSTHVREYFPDKLVVVTTADGWDGVCTRIYERIQ